MHCIFFLPVQVRYTVKYKFLTLNEKSRIDNSRTECVKDVKYIRLKETCLGVLDRGDRDKYNAIGLKEGRVIKMSTTVLHSRAAPSLCILLTSSTSFRRFVKLC